jgi:hypothetical protein
MTYLVATLLYVAGIEMRSLATSAALDNAGRRELLFVIVRLICPDKQGTLFVIGLLLKKRES